MKKEDSKKMVVELSEETIDNLACAIGREVLDAMVLVLEPLHDEIEAIQRELESIESNTHLMLFSDDEEVADSETI